jgi:tripartite-type tricarboxylate transporter receptor subunit TctC
MKQTCNRSSILGLGLLVVLACQVDVAQSAPATAEWLSARPIRWIVPYAAGGPTDMVARVVGERLGERLHQPVVIENLAGALGNIGMDAAARAAPDGHTIVFAATSVVLNAPMHNVANDPLNELTAVSQIATVTYVLVGSTAFAPRTMEEVLAAARAKPGTVSCGFGATLFQLGCELLRMLGRVEIIAVGYKGNAPAMNDLLGGHISLLFDPINTALPQVQAGRVRAIATASPRRGAGPLGGVPTIAETLPGFELTGWFGVLAPAATPRDIIARLNREIGAVLEDDQVRRRLVDAGLEISHGSPEGFSEVIQRDQTRYARIIRDAGIKPD